MNKDGSFTIYGPDKLMMEMAVPDTTLCITRWAGDDVTAVQNIKQHTVHIDLDKDGNDDNSDTLSLVARNLDQTVNNGKDETPSSQGLRTRQGLTFPFLALTPRPPPTPA